MDKMIVEWIEAHTTLHYNVVTLYCVDHYEVFITHNDAPIGQLYCGDTLLEAFVEAMQKHP